MNVQVKLHCSSEVLYELKLYPKCICCIGFFENIKILDMCQIMPEYMLERFSVPEFPRDLKTLLRCKLRGFVLYFFVFVFVYLFIYLSMYLFSRNVCMVSFLSFSSTYTEQVLLHHTSLAEIGKSMAPHSPFFSLCTDGTRPGSLMRICSYLPPVTSSLDLEKMHVLCIF